MKPSKRIIRVVRVLEYEGEEAAVHAHLVKCGVQPGDGVKPLGIGNDVTITEHPRKFYELLYVQKTKEITNDAK